MSISRLDELLTQTRALQLGQRIERGKAWQNAFFKGQPVALDLAQESAGGVLAPLESAFDLVKQ